MPPFLVNKNFSKIQFHQNPPSISMRILVLYLMAIEAIGGYPQTSRFALPEKLKIEVKKQMDPNCVPAQKGDTVSIHFVASLASQDKFFSTYIMMKPLTFEVGEGKEKVMPALNEAVESGMCEGDERTLYIPPNQGYGYNIFGDVKEDSGLVYDVKLEKIVRKSQK